MPAHVIHSQDSLGGDLGEMKDPPKKEIQETIGPAAAALSKVDDFEAELAGWLEFYQDGSMSIDHDRVEIYEQARKLIEAGTNDVHRAMALLHMHAAGVTIPPDYAVILGLDEE